MNFGIILFNINTRYKLANRRLLKQVIVNNIEDLTNNKMEDSRQYVDSNTLIQAINNRNTIGKQ